MLRARSLAINSELVAGDRPVVALHALPRAIAEGISIADPPEPREDCAWKPCFWVDELEAVRGAVLARGARAGEVWEWGGRRHCDCVDPEGNVFQLVEG